MSDFWTHADLVRWFAPYVRRTGLTEDQFRSFRVRIDDSAGPEWDSGETFGEWIANTATHPDQPIGVVVSGGHWFSPVVDVQVELDDGTVWFLIESCIRVGDVDDS